MDEKIFLILKYSPLLIFSFLAILLHKLLGRAFARYIWWWSSNDYKFLNIVNPYNRKKTKEDIKNMTMKKYEKKSGLIVLIISIIMFLAILTIAIINYYNIQ